MSQPVSEVSLRLLSPRNQEFFLPPIPLSEPIISIKQLISELPETCFYTSFHLELVGDDQSSKGVVLHDFMELSEVAGISNESTIKMINDSYDVKKVRVHVKRLKELLLTPPTPLDLSKQQVMQSDNLGLSNQQTTETLVDEKKESVSISEDQTSLSAKLNGDQKEQTNSKDESSENQDEDITADEEKKAREMLEQFINTTAEELGKKRAAIRDKLVPIEVPVVSNLETFFQKSFARPCEKMSTDQGIIGLKSIYFSPFNPPPNTRRLLGELCYINVETVEHGTICVTATPQGYFVNKSSQDLFNPEPASPVHYSKELLPLLQSMSNFFRDSWTRALKQNEAKMKIANDPLSGITNLVFEGKLDPNVLFLQWNTPCPQKKIDEISPFAHHKPDYLRMEDDILNSFGMDERGSIRDWNEEYQSIREMPHESLKDKVMRQRMLNKAMTDFAEAALQGAKAIVGGFIPPLNPNEPENSHIYMFNNIFFSQTADSADSYRIVGGEDAAYKCVSHDINGVLMVNKVEVSGIHTLETALIDYLGYRLLAQSIIPGILQQSPQTNRLIYGAIEPGTSLKTNDEFSQSLAELGKQLLLACRTVPSRPIPSIENNDTQVLNNDEQGPSEVTIYGHVEFKGIQGTDGRKYLLDVGRITPRDANYVLGEKGSGVWNGLTPSDYTVTDDLSALLRMELVKNFMKHKYLEWKKQHVKNEEKSTENQEENTENSEEKITENSEEIDEKGFEFVRSLAMNSNVFMPFQGCTNPEQLKKDESVVVEASKFLWDNVIPAFIKQVRLNILVPLEGKSLTTLMHSYGINMRYLGRMATLSSEEEKLQETNKASFRISPMPLYFLEMLETEMISRACKHILRETFQTRPELRLAPGPTIVEFLNVLLGTQGESSKVDITQKTETNTKKQSKKKDKKQVTAILPTEFVAPFATFKPEELWSAIKKEVKSRFRYDLKLWGLNHNGQILHTSRAYRTSLLRRLCQKFGVRVLSKNYNYGTERPFIVDDVTDIVPVTKYPFPSELFEEIKSLIEAARYQLSLQRITTAYECAQEALILIQQVCGTLHPAIATVFDLLASILYGAGDVDNAVTYQQKALALHLQMHGIDSNDTVRSHISLADYLHGAGHTDAALNHLESALYLVGLVGGPFHPDIAILYEKMAKMYQDVMLLTEAVRCYFVALQQKTLTPTAEAQTFHLMALCFGMAQQFREAITYEKKAFEILSQLHGAEDPRAKEAREYLKSFTEQAVARDTEQRKLKEQAEFEATGRLRVTAATSTTVVTKEKSKKQKSKQQKEEELKKKQQQQEEEEEELKRQKEVEKEEAKRQEELKRKQEEEEEEAKRQEELKRKQEEEEEEAKRQEELKRKQEEEEEVKRQEELKRQQEEEEAKKQQASKKQQNNTSKDSSNKKPKNKKK